MTIQMPLWSPANQLAAQYGRSDGLREVDSYAARDWWLRAVMWPTVRSGRASRTWFGIIAATIAVVRLPAVVNGEWGSALGIMWWQALAVSWMMVVSLAARTITVRHIVAAWLMGIFAAGAFVDAFGTALGEHVSGNAYNAVAVPLLEESAKVIPVVLIVVVARLLGRGVGVVDCGLVGFSAGAGFAFYEDMLYGRMYASGLEGWGWAFPTMLHGPLTAAGHAVWSGCVGLGIGLVVVHAKHWWAWSAGTVAVVLPMVDHAAINYRGPESEGLRARMWDGNLVPAALFCGFVAILIVETRLAQRAWAADHLFRAPALTKLLTERPTRPFAPQGSARQRQRLHNEAAFQWAAGRPSRHAIAYELGLVTTPPSGDSS